MATLGSLWDDFGITLGSFGITLVSIGVTLGSFWDHVWDDFRAFSDPLGGLRSSLGRQVRLEAELWGPPSFVTKTCKLAEAFIEK